MIEAFYYKKNITFVGNGDSSSNGARIKIWAGPVGSAIVNDIQYEDLSVRFYVLS
jgi:hypothetical protein